MSPSFPGSVRGVPRGARDHVVIGLGTNMPTAHV